MNLDWKSLLTLTDLKNKKCVRETLEGMGITTYIALQNLPGKYGQPWLCQNGTNQVVAALNEAIKEANASVPSIEEAIEVAAPKPKPQKPAITADTLVTTLDIDGVTKRQLAQISEQKIETVGQLFEASDALDEIPGIGKATKDRILQAVTSALEKQ